MKINYLDMDLAGVEMRVNKTNRKRWTKKDKQWLIKNYKNTTIKECATKLNRTANSIMSMVLALNLTIKRTGIKKHYLYNTFALIKSRCYNPKCKTYKNYGGRGIKMLDEWIKSPKKFIEYIEKNLGDRPKGYTIDRINNMLGYFPNNLKWSSAKEQSRNKRNNKLNNKDVETIREKVKNGQSHRSIAKEFSICKTSVTSISNYTNWKDIE